MSCGPDFEDEDDDGFEDFLDEWDDDFDSMDEELDESECDSELFDDPLSGV